ncbi:MAG: response regulator transcription factor [Chloroflexi bacterium]|nr:response regulator transcription factor [Chloroflexota bacterium]
MPDTKSKSVHTLLLADDHAVVRAGIRKALEGMPFLRIIGEVGDGPSLFAALEDQTPDLLLIDITMPGFDPLEDTAVIRQRYPHMRILVVSAYDDDVYVQGLFRIGVDGYHLKDQPLKDLRLAVERVLQGERWVCAPLLDKLIRYVGAGETSPVPLSLTPRQRDILRLLYEGLDNQRIARRLNLSVKTVENHLTRLYRQLGVTNRLEAVQFVHRHPYLIYGTQTPPAQTAVPVSEPPPAERVVVLIVDDNARYRRQLHHMILRVHPQAQVHEAENIADAVQIARRVQPHLAFVDVILRGENGIRCVRQIKAVSPDSRVVLISAYPDREFHRLGVAAGAVAFLDKKDLDMNTLRQIVEDAAASSMSD